MDFKLNNFESISLSQMEGIRLMKRVDRKYIIPLRLLPHTLDTLVPHYYIQEIDGIRLFDYATLYYDTSDYEMYKTHQNGNLNRIKIRTRKYVDSNLCFLEIKRKSNKGVTRKIRIINKTPDSIKNEHSSSFLSLNSPYSPDSLEEKVWSFYRRITLVNKEKTERLTIDLDISFRNKHTGRKVSLPELVVIEIKKERLSCSPVMDSLNRLRIKPKNMSKYCLGVALTENPEEIKINAIKKKLRDINKITSYKYGTITRRSVF